MLNSAKSRFIVLDKQLNGGSVTLGQRIRQIIDEGNIPGTSNVEVVNSLEEINHVKESSTGTVDVIVYSGSSSKCLPFRDGVLLSLGTSGFQDKELDDNRPFLILPSRPSKEALEKAMIASFVKGSHYLSQKHLEENGNIIGFYGLGQASYATAYNILKRNRVSDNHFSVLFADYGSDSFNVKFKQIKKQFQDQNGRFDVVDLEGLTKAGIISLTASNAKNNVLGQTSFGNPRYDMYRNGNAFLVKDFFEKMAGINNSFLPVYMVVTNDSFLSARALLELSSRTGRLWNVFSPSELDSKRIYDTLVNEIADGILKNKARVPSSLISKENTIFRISGTHSSPLLLSRSSKVYDDLKQRYISFKTAYGITASDVESITELVQLEADEWVESGFQPDEFAEMFVKSIDSVVYSTRSHLGQPIVLSSNKLLANPSVNDVREGKARYLTLYTSWANRGTPKPITKYRAGELRQVKKIIDEEDRIYRAINQEVFGTSILS